MEYSQYRQKKSAAERQTDALERQADETARLRALKEYELGVLTTSGIDGDTITVVAGRRVKIGPEEFAEQGTTIYDEDKGLVAE